CRTYRQAASPGLEGRRRRDLPQALGTSQGYPHYPSPEADGWFPQTTLSVSQAAAAEPHGSLQAGNPGRRRVKRRVERRRVERRASPWKEAYRLLRDCPSHQGGSYPAVVQSRWRYTERVPAQGPAVDDIPV